VEGRHRPPDAGIVVSPRVGQAFQPDDRLQNVNHDKCVRLEGLIDDEDVRLESLTYEKCSALACSLAS
jgi:hypothetical protein